MRDIAIGSIERFPALARLTIAMASSFARARGADAVILDEARREALPLNRSLQVIQWAMALAGSATFPRYFNPGDHLRDPRARTRATAALARLESDRPEVRRQLIGLDDAATLLSTLNEVEADLRLAIKTAARTSVSRPGVDGDLQLEVVREVTAALEDGGLEPFLMSGSLLGVVREGRFMDHDYDIDLGLLPGADLAGSISILSNHVSLQLVESGSRLHVRHSSGVSVDVFPHTLREGLFWHSTWVHEWWNTPFALTRTDVKNVPLWIPDDPGRYLDENYGRWDQPVPFYDISFDTPNRVYRQNHHAIRFLHSRCISAMRLHDRWMFESAIRELRDSFGVDVTELIAASPLVDGLGAAPAEAPPGTESKRRST